MYDANGKPILSPAAQIDDAEYLRRCALELTKMEAPTMRPTPIRSGITKAQLDKRIGNMLKGMGEIIGKEFRALRLRVEQLEAERGLKYVGPWKIGASYSPGEFVSYGGGVWHCKQRTGTRPNECHEAWTLAVKSGSPRK